MCINISIFFHRLSAGQEENPLAFADIVDEKTYDKMRPPKPDGKFADFFTYQCHETAFSNLRLTVFPIVDFIVLSTHYFSFSGGATEVYFHVTVMSLDTIDEGSMVSLLFSR